MPAARKRKQQEEEATLSAYEMERAENMINNEAILSRLGLDGGPGFGGAHATRVDVDDSIPQRNSEMHAEVGRFYEGLVPGSVCDNGYAASIAVQEGQDGMGWRLNAPDGSMVSVTNEVAVPEPCVPPPCPWPTAGGTRPRPTAGRIAFMRASSLEFWADGSPYGKVHHKCFLKADYADSSYNGRKRLEGRPLHHPITDLQPGDCIKFQIAGEPRLRTNVPNEMYSRVHAPG